MLLHDAEARRGRPPPKGRCTGKCVKRSSLRWALMGNPTDRCGPQYGCVNGCCRHAKEEEVRQRVQQCVQGNCWFNNRVCMDPCRCSPPGNGWFAHNQHLPGTCELFNG
ncbi:hypothetical protein AAVH_24388 [Aphelenchoides avenae]|nr:hypothetical protein AAVH_24388 [Aphelenchus avenae]